MPSEKELEDFLQFYDYKIPHPEHEPIRFQYAIKLYKYYRSCNPKNDQEKERERNND